MPVDAVYLWLLTPVLFYCTGGYGCNAHPAFPAPSYDFEGGSFEQLGRMCAARSRTRVSPSFRDGAKHQTRNLEIPGSSLRDAPE
jgi:hypothetical protein